MINQRCELLQKLLLVSDNREGCLTASEKHRLGKQLMKLDLSTGFTFLNQ